MKKTILFLLTLALFSNSLTAATFNVTNANNLGVGSLRQAILDANTLAGLDQIDFSGPFTIVLTSALPTITSPVFINGPFTTGPQIELDGTTNNVAGAGLILSATASGSSLTGLNIHGFSNQGILLLASNTKIAGCYIGTNLNGTLDLGNTFAGIEIAPNVKNIQIGGTSPDSSNVISGNGQSGINIAAGCDSIVIKRNKIGCNALGSSNIANNQTGILANNVSHLIIGGGSNSRNIISGNGQNGITLSNCPLAIISGNYIGSTASGVGLLSNGGSGIQVNVSIARIGGTTSDSANVISGNLQIGIDVLNSNNTVIKGNFIGVGSDGVTALGNLISHGIQFANSTNGIIGGATSAEKNVISKNGSHGILINNSTNISIQGNYIGTDITGTIALGNNSHGIQLQTAVSGIVIGGRRFIEGNIISSNLGSGINFEAAASGKIVADGTIIKGNLIGTDITTTLDLGNAIIGIILKSDNCIIGDENNTEGNVLAGTNVFCGLLIANGNNNSVRGNFIGVSLNGTTPIPNNRDGIIIAVEDAGQTANNNSIQNNTIAYNTRHGINVGAALNSFSSNNEMGNNISVNKIYCNTGLGISLNLSNPADQGNNGQKAPSINYFLSTANVVQGVTDPSLAGKKIHLYLMNDCISCDVNPQGKVIVDSLIVSGTGAWSYDYFAKFGTIIPGDIVATAKDLLGNTSEFSKCCKSLSGTTITPSINPVCPASTFNIQYSNGQEGDSLMLQMSTNATTGPWTNVSRRKLADPITFSSLSITDTTFFRFITYSQGSFATAACKDSSTVLQVNLAAIAVAGTATITEDTICNGEPTTSNLAGFDGTIQWQRSITGGAFLDISGASLSSLTTTPTSTQSPVLYRAKLSKGTCPDVFSNNVSVIIPAVSSGTISGPSKLCNKESGTFTLTNSTGTIQWQDSLASGSWNNLAGQTTTSLIYTPSAVVTTDYIRVILIDVFGKCTEISNPFPVVADTCTDAQPILLPNALTPNGDGNNDAFYINNIWLYPNNHLLIYNRWGNKVFETNGYNNDWEGKNGTEKLPEATYYYVLELGEDLNGDTNEKNKYHGSVTIIR